MKEKIPSGTKWVVGWTLDSPDPLKPLATGWENTERITSLYSYSQVLTESVNLPGLPCRFNKAAAYRPQLRWLQCTHHTLPSFRLQLAQTDVSLQEQRIYGVCAPRGCLQLCQLPSPTYLGVRQKNYQHTCNPKPNSYPYKTGRLLYHQGAIHPIYLTQKAPKPVAGKLFEVHS